MTDARKAASNAEVESAALVDGLPEQESVSRTPAPQGDGVVEALRSAREEIEQARASVSGDDGYNYASGEEYGLRRAVIILDKALAALSAKGEASPAEAAGADPRMIARIRELSTPPKDDYDRAVHLLIESYEGQEAAHQAFRLQNDREWRAKLDHAKPVAAPPVEGWRPRETAPKQTGARFLVWVTDAYNDDGSRGKHAFASVSAGGAITVEGYSQGYKISGWQPLPTQPDSQGGEDA